MNIYNLDFQLNLKNYGEWISEHTIQYAYKRWYNYTEQQMLDCGCRYTELIMGKYSGDVYIDDKAIFSDDFFSS